MNIRIPLYLALSLTSAGLLVADTFNLRDGTSLEGEILAETTDDYTISVQVTATIRDERTISKADVVSIDKDSPVDLAFASIKDLVPSANRLGVADYDLMINKKVKQFLSSFPTTRYTSKAKAILSTLEKEREIVSLGGLKLDGQWISPGDRNANAFDLDARMAVEDATVTAKAGHFRKSMRQFEVIEREFSTSEQFAKGVEMAKKVLQAYGKEVGDDLKQIDSLIAEREKELQRLPNSQQQKAQAEIKKIDLAYTALIAKEKKSRTKWLTLEMYHQSTLDETARTIDTELRRLTNLDLSKITLVGSSYRNAWAAAEGANTEEAEKLFSELNSRKVPARYVAALKEQLASSVASKESASTEGDGTSTEDGDAENSTEDGMEKSAVSGETKATAAEESLTSAAEEPGTDAPGSDDEGSSGMTTLLYGVMGLVLVVALVAVFAGGKKKKKSK